MRHNKSSWVSILFVIVFTLSACNIGQDPEPTPDVGAIFTSAAETVSAQFSQQLTQTALAQPTATQPPTATPIATFSFGGSPAAPLIPPIATLGIGTPSATIDPLASPTLAVIAPTQAGPLCNDSAWTGLETIPDGTVMSPGKEFTKTWEIKNTGFCTWDEGYKLAYLGGALGGKTIEIKLKKDFVEPGENQTFVQKLKAPTTPNTYTDCWKMQDDSAGYYFGTYLCASIVVE